MSKLQMDAYYYSFEPTGVPEIDEILSAVAEAGSGFHHTADWNTKCHGTTPVEWIQEAANRAANKFKEK